MKEFQGIDVSYCQKTVNWQKVKESGIRFAMVRTARCHNDGRLKMDGMFEKHIQGALAAGLDVGAWVYSYATTPAAARRAARELVAAVKPYKVTYPLALDIEYEDIYINATPEQNTKIVAAFCDEV